MTSPPDCFGAHDGAAVRACEGYQFVEAFAERPGLGVIRIVAEGQNAPERIFRRRHILGMVTPPTERAQVLVANSLPGERLWQHVQIELWGCARARNGTDVNEEIDVHLSQQCDELGDRSG